MSSPSELESVGTHHHWLAKWILAFLAAVIIFLALAVGAFRIAVNLLPQYHNRVEQIASQVTGQNVSLGRISLRWVNWGPQLVASNVTVTSSVTHEVSINAKRVGISFSLGSVFQGMHARPRSIQIDRPTVIVHRSLDSLSALAQLLMSKSKSSSHPTIKGNMVSSLRNMNIDVKSGVARFIAPNKKNMHWTFSSIDLLLHNGLHHRFVLRFTMPRQFGKSPFSLSGTIAMRGGKPADWLWHARVSLSSLRLAGIDAFLSPQYGFKSGLVGLQSTLRGRGVRVTSIAGHFAAVQTRLRALHLRRLSANFVAQFGVSDSISLNNFKLEERHLTWAPGEVRMEFGPNQKFRVAVGHINLAAVTNLAELLPPRYALISERLRKMRATGAINHFAVAMRLGNFENLNLSASLDGISFYNAMGAPGLRNLNASVLIQHGQGRLNLSGPLTLWMPHLFGHSVPLEQVDGTLQVKLLPVGFSIATSSLRIRGAGGLEGSIHGAIRYVSKQRIDLALRARADPLGLYEARRLYLPTGLIPKPLVHWLLYDLVAGRITGMTMSLSGNARKFPFRSNQGQFLTEFRFQSVKLKPGEKWQPISHLSGSVGFHNTRLDARITDGIVSGARIVSGTARMPDIFKPKLRISASIRGRATNFLTFLKSGPIGAKSVALLSKLRARGRVSTQVHLDLPIHSIKKFSLRGQLSLDGVALSYSGVPTGIEKLKGRIQYNREGPLDGKLSAKAIGSPIELNFSRKPKNRMLTVGFHTRIAVNQLPSRYRSEFGKYAAGTLPLMGRITVPLSGAVDPLAVKLTSSLVGLELKLPEPLGKPLNQAVRTVATLRKHKNSYELSARYGSRLGVCISYRYLTGFKLLPEGAGVRLGKGRCLVPRKGLQLSGTWPTVNVGEWARYMGHIQSGKRMQIPKPITIAAEFGHVSAFGTTLRDVSVSGTNVAGSMKLSLRGPDLTGQIEIPSRLKNDAPIMADIGYLDLTHAATKARPTVAAAQPKSHAAGKSTSFLRPNAIPAFNLSINKIQLPHGFLRDVRIQVHRVPNGVLIRPIEIKGGLSRLNGSAIWLKAPGKLSQGALHFVANVHQLGDLLDALGPGPVITGHGSVSASLAWHGSVDNNQFWKTLVGRFSTDIRDGSISQVQVGAGRFLSLLNLANVPRYLTLDFHNLFSKGFPFSRIHGNYNIRNGIARTRGMIIDSSVAHIKLTGSINLINQTMNQQAEINPNYTGSLPVVAAILGGLGLGAAIFAVTKIFGSPIAQATALHYTIRGPISKPVVRKKGPPTAGNPRGSH